MATLDDNLLERLKSSVLQNRIEIFLTEHKNREIFSATEVKDFLLDLWTEIGET